MTQNIEANLNSAEYQKRLREILLKDLSENLGEDVSAWKKARMKQFHEEIAQANMERLRNDDALRKSLGLQSMDIDEGNRQWGFAVSTFQNAIKTDRQPIGSRKLRSLAIYLGYNSAEHYLDARLGDYGPPVEYKEKLTGVAEGHSSQPEKGKSRIGMYAVIALLATAVVAMGWWFSQKEELPAFAENKQVSILIFPFTELAGVEGQNYHFEEALMGELEVMLAKDAYCDSIIEVVMMPPDQPIDRLAEKVRIGEEIGADLILWGTYQDYGNANGPTVTLRYRYLDEGLNSIAESQGEYGGLELVIDDDKTKGYGQFVGSIQENINTLMASIAGTNLDYARVLHYLSDLDEDAGPGAYFLRGYAHYMSRNKGQMEQAYLDTKKAAEAFVDHQWSWNNLSVFSRNTGRYEEAEEAALKALVLDSTYFKAMVSLGNVYMTQPEKRYQDAIHWYQKSLSYQPNDAITLWNLGEAYFEIGDYAQSAKYFNLYDTAVPDDPDIEEWRQKIEDAVNLSSDSLSES